MPLFDPDAVRSRDDGAPFELDLACRHLLQFIDGRRSVERLVALSQLRQEIRRIPPRQPIPPCCLCLLRTMGCSGFSQKPWFCYVFFFCHLDFPDPLTLGFWKKSKGNPEKCKGFSLRGIPKILGKGRKTHKKAREIGKQKKQGSQGLSLAHQNRSDFCDLRLRCPSRTPEIARFPRQDN